MGMFEPDSGKWAELIFGSANLNDKRRTDRLVKIATDVADSAGKSIVKASKNPADIEAAYRFIENDYIDPKAIAQAGFDATAKEARKRQTVLALEDTTGLSYTHSVCKELGNNPSSKNSSCKGRSLFQHSILALDADTETVIGLAHQQNYIREEKVQGSGSVRSRRRKEEKESYRWEESSIKMDDTFKNTDNVIHVCDREADSYEYIAQHLDKGRRFIIRSSHDRKLSAPVANLRALVEEPIIAEHDVKIEQKGNGSKDKTNRPARIARVGISYHTITMKKPHDAIHVTNNELTVNVVICRELGNPDEESSLCWYLYTNEPINCIEDARKIVRYYELRWRIEDFHKVWKSDGTQVEKLRLQTKANIERMSVILAFVAVRLMQLKEMAENREEAKQQSCELMFGPLEWLMLWQAMEKTDPPNKPPSLHWAYYALSRLGGWHDSKGTGRVSVKTIWEGWMILMHMMNGYQLMPDTG